MNSRSLVVRAAREVPLALLALGMLLPLAYLLSGALFELPQLGGWLTTPFIQTVLLNTLGLLLSVGLLAGGLGLGLGWLLYRTDLPGRRYWRVLLMLPYTLPSFIMAFAWLAALAERGMLKQLWPGLAWQPFPALYGWAGATLVLGLASYPYVLGALKSTLQSLDPRQEEVARTLGVRGWRLAWRVILPQLMPAWLAGVTWVGLYVLSDFGAVSMLQFPTLTRAIYLQFTIAFDQQAASLLAGLLSLLALGLLWIRRWADRHRGRDLAPIQPRADRLQPLGWWRWPAWVLCAAVFAVGFLGPILTLLYWAFQAWRRADFTGLSTAIWTDSLLLASGAALLAVGLALFLVIAMRLRRRLASAVQWVAEINYALPGVLVAIAVVYVVIRWLPGAYHTFGLLLVVYALRYLPLVSGGLVTQWRRISPRLGESARMLGASRWEVFRRVEWPLLRPAAVAGAGLAWMGVLKELPMMLILSPPGYSTLATRIWDSSREGFFGRAAWPALALILLSALVMWLTARYEEVKIR